MKTTREEEVHTCSLGINVKSLAAFALRNLVIRAGACVETRGGHPVRADICAVFLVMGAKLYLCQV